MGKKVQFDPDIKEIEELAAQGLTIDQICDVIDCHRSTLYRHKKENKDLKDAVKRGQSQGVGVATNALMELVKEKNVPAVIFYLKNRAKDQWRDKWDLEHSQKDGTVFEVSMIGVDMPGDDDAADST